MVDSFFLSIDWTTVAMLIGVLVSVIGAVVYIRPDGR
jgi:type III secretory pathway component EscS